MTGRVATRFLRSCYPWTKLHVTLKHTQSDSHTNSNTRTFFQLSFSVPSSLQITAVTLTRALIVASCKLWLAPFAAGSHYVSKGTNTNPSQFCSLRQSPRRLLGPCYKDWGSNIEAHNYKTVASQLRGSARPCRSA